MPHSPAPAEQAEDQVSSNSELKMIDDVLRLSDAGCSVIQIQTAEPWRAATALRRRFSQSDEFTYNEWDAIHGMRNMTADNHVGFAGAPTDIKSIDPFYGLNMPMQATRDPSSPIRMNADRAGMTHMFAYVGMNPMIGQSPRLQQLIQQYAEFGASTALCILLITPQEPLSLPPGVVSVVKMSAPTEGELFDSMARILSGAHTDDTGKGYDHPIEDSNMDEIARLGMGMGRTAFENAISIGIHRAMNIEARDLETDDLLSSVRAGKVDIVAQSDVLELFHTEQMSAVGGMDALKQWIEHRRDAFSEEARAFGVSQPKGVFVVGVPGSGKSLISKAIAGYLGRPLVRLDFARVYGKYVGTSETRIRQALDMVDEMGDVVLFADEIDKGLGGSGGEDGGVASRVLGTFLTWMQESKTRAFVVLTANRIEALPPELYRKGRIDEVFAALLPNDRERCEILRVHVTKRKHPYDYTDADIAQFIKNSDGFVGSEIENVVNAALLTAFTEGAEGLEMSHILRALAATKPLSVTQKDKIDKIIEWATANAVSVSSDPDETPAKMAPQQEQGRRINARPRPGVTRGRTTH